MKNIITLLIISFICMPFVNAMQIEAETYTAMSGIITQSSSDEGGGDHIANIKNGDWAEYIISADAGYYEFSLRVSSKTEGGVIRIKENGEIIGTARVLGTGDWNTWETVSIPVHFLSSGNKSIRLEFEGEEGYLYNINWFGFTQKPLGSSSILFDAKGKPTSVIINGKELLADAGSSFNTINLLEYDGKEIVTTTDFEASRSGNMLYLSAKGGEIKFTMQIDEYPRHISIHLVDVEGIGENRNYGLRLQTRMSNLLGYQSLSDLVEGSITTDIFSFRNYWRYLYATDWDGYRGGIAFWDASLEGRELDETLAEVWTTEERVLKPADQPSWTESDVLNWVDVYAEKFNNMNQILLTPTDLDDLYKQVETVVIPNKIKQVYLHCGTWRGEYWPRSTPRDYVNTEMFPNGREDLKAFIDYLHENDILIHLHNLSFSIGKSEEKYVGGTVDRRLATWGKGTLEFPFEDNNTAFYFRPDEDVEVPLIGTVSHVGGTMYYNYFRIGEEIVSCDDIKRTDKEVWHISNCERAEGITIETSHDAGTEVAGLYVAYNVGLLPAYDFADENSLSKELVKEYADFINEMELDHLHFDGPELHDYAAKWTRRPYQDWTYRLTNRPATTSRVGGTIAANFELKFSKVKDDASYNYFPIDITIRLDELKKDALANSFFDTHYHATECLALGSRRLNLTGSYHAQGIYTEAIENHGLADTILYLYRSLQELTPVFEMVDEDYLRSSMNKNGTHYESDYVNILSKNAEGEYIYTTHLILGKSDGSTDPWKIYQERGSIARKQETETGTALSLNNPDAQSDLNCIIRVSDASKSLVNPQISLSTGGSLSVTGTIAAGEYLQYEAGENTVIHYDNNWNVLDKLSVTVSNFVASSGSISITLSTDESGIAIEAQYYIKGDPYILKSNSNL